MGATSIHVQAVKPGSEIHNFREKELDYVRPELSHLNESWVGDSISHRLESAKQRYLDTVGQKMQAKAAPIRERSNSNQTRNHHAGTPAVCHGLQRTFRYRSISNPYTQGRRIHERKAMDT